jgi:3-hydroxybutyryl-CoA dehydratase
MSDATPAKDGEILSQGYYFEDLETGMEASYAKTITEADVNAFAALSGDVNPVHMSDDFAAGTMFKKRIAHGFLTGSLISTVLGTKLPGPGSIYLSQELKFRAPVFLGDTVTATARIASLDEAKGRVTLSCVCSVDGKPVLTGDAVIMVPRKASAS